MPLSNSLHDIPGQRRLTRELGEYVTHYPVLPCSCAREQPEGHPLPTCQVCGGSGRAYGHGRRVRGLVAALNSGDRTLLQSGLAMPGDMTFSPEVLPAGQLVISDYDVIRLGYGQAYEGDTLIRGEDLLSYRPSLIRLVEQHNSSTGARIWFQRNLDYTIEGRRVVWAAGRGPAMGAAYAVRYDAIYDWVVYPGVTVQRIDRGAGLGQRVLLRKRHLAGVGAVLPDDQPVTWQATLPADTITAVWE
jgi:hypothetical protein